MTKFERELRDAHARLTREVSVFRMDKQRTDDALANAEQQLRQVKAAINAVCGGGSDAPV